MGPSSVPSFQCFNCLQQGHKADSCPNPTAVGGRPFQPRRAPFAPLGPPGIGPTPANRPMVSNCYNTANSRLQLLQAPVSPERRAEVSVNVVTAAQVNSSMDVCVVNTVSNVCDEYKKLNSIQECKKYNLKYLNLNSDRTHMAAHKRMGHGYRAKKYESLTGNNGATVESCICYI